MSFKVMYWHDANRNGAVDEDIQCVAEFPTMAEALPLACELFNRGEYHTSFIVDSETGADYPVPLITDENGNMIAQC